MGRKVKISVVVPVYNVEEYLIKCLDSLHRQKYSDLEFVLIDDGSTDSSLEICENFARIDDRFIVIHKENAGPSSARNLAIDASCGEYITFVDSDDYIREDAYTVIAKKLEKHNDPDILVFGAELYPDGAADYLYNMVHPRDIEYEEFEPRIVFEEVGSRPFLWLQVIKKSIIVNNNIRMNESMNLGEDQLFQIELFPFANRIVYIGDCLYTYRWNRTSSLMDSYGKDRLKKLMAHIRIVENVFDVIFTDRYKENMKQATFNWSVFFLWGDLMDMLEEEQLLVCGKLREIWEKNDTINRFYDTLDIWGKLRVNQMLILSEPDKDKKIQLFDEANAKLEEELLVLRKNPRCRRALKRELRKKKRKQNKSRLKENIKKLRRKIRENGLFRTVKKILRKVKRKIKRILLERK